MEKEDREFMAQIMELRDEFEKYNEINRWQWYAWLGVGVLLFVSLLLQLKGVGWF